MNSSTHLHYSKWPHLQKNIKNTDAVNFCSTDAYYSTAKSLSLTMEHYNIAKVGFLLAN